LAATSVKPVFISHATEADGEFAGRLAGDLRRLGVQVWMAPESIRTSESWVKAIERGLRESSHVVIVLTPAALESKWVEKETDVAIARERGGQIEVIPLFVEQVEVPLLLDSYHMVFFRQGYEAGLNRLAGDLGLSVAPAKPEVVSPPMVEPSPPFEPELIHIPAGEFLMGSDPKKDKDARDNEKPQHTLHLSDYHIAKTPVTNAQYLPFVQAIYRQPMHWEAGQPPPGKENHPVVNVSWHDAMAYCRWLAEATGKAYRLPSEAEWEKAARGTDGRIWPWGNEWDPRRCNSSEGGPRETTPVGQYSPEGDSPYGCVDMEGNVWEWCTTRVGKRYPYDVSEDEWSEEYLQGSAARVLRGGSWFVYRNSARCAVRGGVNPGSRSYDLGFRLVSPI
jgi:formylglycine-generating enzyme required for sulfatase activity